MFLKLLRGTATDRTLSHWFVAIAIVGLWSTFFLGNKRLQELGQQRRLHGLVANLRQDLPHFPEVWSDKVELPHLGTFTVDTSLGGKLLVSDSFVSSYQHWPYLPISEQVVFIEKLEGGAINVTVQSDAVTYIDYRPDDRPRPIPAALGRHVTTRIAPHWFIDRVED